MNSLEARVRIVSWNVNGLRSVCPDGIHNLFARLQDELPVDTPLGILCLQETKMSRLSADLCVQEGYHSYFSICRNSRDTGRERGYSGVATFVRKDIPTFRSQEGFVGTGDPSIDVLSFSSLFSTDGLSSTADHIDISAQDATSLSEEGRVLFTGATEYSPKKIIYLISLCYSDHGAFILVNVYAPCAYDPDSKRFEYKTKFNYLLERYISELQSQDKSVVSNLFTLTCDIMLVTAKLLFFILNNEVLVGDLNATLARIDHCDPDLFSPETPYEERLSVMWLNGLLVKQKLIDSFRYFYPEVCVNITVTDFPDMLG